MAVDTTSVVSAVLSAAGQSTLKGIDAITAFTIDLAYVQRLVNRILRIDNKIFLMQRAATRFVLGK